MQAIPQIGQTSFPGPINGPAALPPSVSHAIICLHGFGSNGNDLIALAPAFNTILGNLAESLAVYAPNAPAPTRLGEGLQWFSDASWTFRDRTGIESSSQALWAYVNQVANHHDIPLSNIALLGFSQGAMLALYAAPRWPKPIGAIIGCSGAAMWQEELDAATCQKPPTLLLHGIDDDVLPADSTVMAATGLQSLGFPVEHYLIPHLGHGINPQCLAHIAVFLQSLWQSHT